MSSQDVYLWVDLETTGLDPVQCEITEFAYIVTKGPDTGFEEIKRGQRVIQPENADRQTWQRGALDMARKSGLLEKIDAGHGRSLSSLDDDLCLTLARFDRVFLAARNVGFERGFIEGECMGLADRLHYRAFDVTPLCQIDPTLYNFEHGIEGTPHRAMFDIERDLAYAREFVRRYNGEVV